MITSKSLSRSHVSIASLWQASCFDCERLLTLAFDNFAFLRSFPRARIEALRRKHQAHFLATEESASRRPIAEAMPHIECQFGGNNAESGIHQSQGWSGASHVVRSRAQLISITDEARCCSEDLFTTRDRVECNSSDEDDDGVSMSAPSACDDDDFEILSADDLPPTVFASMGSANTARGNPRRASVWV